jgi:hypothetical protein
MVSFKDPKLASLNKRLLAKRTNYLSFLRNGDRDCSVPPCFGVQALIRVSGGEALWAWHPQDRNWLTILAAAANCAR